MGLDTVWDTLARAPWSWWGQEYCPWNTFLAWASKDWSPFSREVAGALQCARKKWISFIVPNTNIPLKALLHIHSMAKLQVKQVLNQIHYFSHTGMRKGTVTLKKATPSAPVDAKGWFTPPLTLTWPQQLESHEQYLATAWYFISYGHSQ